MRGPGGSTTARPVPAGGPAAAALQRRTEATCEIDTWDDFVQLFQGDGGFAHCHWCGDGACEQTIQDKTKVTIRNVPFERDTTAGTCVHCGTPSRGRVLFAQSY